MKKSILALTLLAATSVQALDLDVLHIGDMDRADTKIIVGFGSHHFDPLAHKALNETNPSIGLEMWDIQSVYVAKNSWGNESLYVTYTPDYEINKYFTVSANIGFATNYKCTDTVRYENLILKSSFCSDSGVIPMGGASIDYSPFANNFNLSVAITPVAAMFTTNYKF